MHVIIGKGNLGIDLKLALTKAGHRAVIFTKSSGFEWPESEPAIRELKPSHIWITAGFGSVGECSADFAGALATHVALPMDIARVFTCPVGVFSTDYVADPEYLDQPGCYIEKPRSFYAHSKLMMERGLERMDRPYITVFRVGSLYGSYFPQKTFPGRLKINHPLPTQLNLPDNIVVPTPTSWVAERIVSNLHSIFIPEFKVHHVAPKGGCSTRDWGKLILGPDYQVYSSGLDPLRPARSSLGCTIDKTYADWKTLWEQHNSVNFDQI